LLLRLQTWQQPDDPFMEPLEDFAQAVEDGTKGSVQVELYPESPIWGIAEAVKQGEVEMGLLYSVVLQDSPSVMDGGSLPFLYNDDDGLMAAVQAGIGDLMTEQIKDMTVLGWTTIGFSHLFHRTKCLLILGML
jgi:TRAP-type C4-dicarboxylate transport system substrate-binding protein